MKFLLVLMLFLVTSCTVTKRYHMKGYSVQWKKHYVSADKKVVQQESNVNETDETLTAAISVDQTKIISDDSALQIKFNQPNLHRKNNTTRSAHISAIPSSIKPITIVKKLTEKPTRIIQYIDDEALHTTSVIGWVIVGIGAFLLICVLIALTGVSSYQGVVSLIANIIFGLIGLGLITAFGVGGAVLFTLGIAAVGLVIVLVSTIPLKRRNRYKEDRP